MEITATEEQIKKIAAAAAQASSPVGMGLLHFNPDFKFQPEQFNFVHLDGKKFLDLDYVQGRCVKITIKQVDGDRWNISGDQPRADYQTWCTTYKTNADLVASVIK